MSHELFLTTRQKTKTRNAFINNKLTDKNLSKYQLAKISQLGRLLGKILGNLGKKVLLDLAVPLAKDVLPKLVAKTTYSLIYKLERSASRKDVVIAGKGFPLFISNEDIGDLTKIVDSLEKSGLLFGGVIERVKQ